MDEQAIRYAVLRDGRDWDESVRLTGLEPWEDGSLILARVPGTTDGKPIVVPGLPAGEPSGLAAGDCHDLYIADTENHRIVRVDQVCNAATLLPGAGGGGSASGQFQNPRGLLVLHDSLYVADSGNGRVQVYRLPSFELRDSWEGPLQEPIALAADSQGRIYVLDRGLSGLRRFSHAGVPDAGFAVALGSPVSLAIDAQDHVCVTVCVTGGQSNQIQCFDAAGQALGAITCPASLQLGALAAHGDRWYVADDASGTIWIFDGAACEFLGTLPDYRGPVAALAIDQSGTLYIKPGLDDAYHVLAANTASVASGYLTAGPFDAGADSVWERAHVDVELPIGTEATLRIFTAVADTAIPDWAMPETLASSLDTLIATVGATTPKPPTPQRHLWLRVELQGDDQRRASPTLKQVQVETTAPSYISHLPAVYRRDDQPGRFLEHWLALFRSELGDLELALDDMPRRFDPHTAPDDGLAWLASWLAFELPPDLTADELRRVLQQVHELYERRGTPAGLCDLVELYTGVRPGLFEAFRERHVWQLGYTSTLGCDTALAAGLPDGMIVPGHTLADPQYMGLRGDYYRGIDFQALEFSRRDPAVDFAWDAGSPFIEAPPNGFTVRWTGQIDVAAGAAGAYTFYILTAGGFRLTVDGRLILDDWAYQPLTERSIQLTLNDGTHDIVLEYWKAGGNATAKLYWSNVKQPKEILRQNFEGQYYNGTHFESLVMVRSDPAIDFDWGTASPFTDYFSVRWTGQVSPRYSERYTFHVLSDDGVRLYVDGVPVIDKWIDQPPTEHSSAISLELEAERWYSIQLEYYEKTGGATIKLYWSSRNQPKEIIPQSRLYSVRDETARLELSPLEKQAGAMLVGQTVVGESGPLAAADFGMPLYSETAHLFTLTVPAGALPRPEQREALRRIVDAEKPAHTDYHLCFVEPRMRVGLQARLGVDSIVAGPPPPLDLEGAELGVDSYLAGDQEQGQAARVDQAARLGQDTRIG